MRSARGWLSLTLLWAGHAVAEQPLATYPGAPPTRIGADLLISGELYRVAYFVTADAPATVARYFQRTWQRDGYPVTVDSGSSDEWVVSAFATREGLQRSIVLRRHLGQTLGFTVLKDLWVRGEQATATHLPTLEGALFAHDAVMRGEAGGTQSRSALLATGVQPVREGRVRAWAAQGFSLARESRVRGDDGVPHRVLELARGGEQVVVTLVELGARTTALQETWVGSDRADAVPNDDALRKAAGQGAR